MPTFPIFGDDSYVAERSGYTHTVYLCPPREDARLEYQTKTPLFPGVEPGCFARNPGGLVRRDLDNEPTEGPFDEELDLRVAAFVEKIFELPGVIESFVYIEEDGFTIDWDRIMAPAEFDLYIIRLIAETFGAELDNVWVITMASPFETESGSYKKCQHYAETYAGPVFRGEKTPEQAFDDLIPMM